MSAIKKFLIESIDLPQPIFDAYISIIDCELVQINGWVLPDFFFDNESTYFFNENSEWFGVCLFIDWYPHYDTDEIQYFSQKVVDVWNHKADITFPNRISDFQATRWGYSEDAEDEVGIIVCKRT